MAVTPAGTPYVESSDNVADYPGVSLALANHIDTLGKVLQVVNVQTTGVATGTTPIPNDDTIPQITEGTQFMSLAITPTNVNNILIVNVVVQAGSSVATNAATSALFQDSTADALAVASIFNPTANQVYPVTFTFWMVAGTTSATTFRVRSGIGDPGTITFNGASGARKFGATVKSSMTITEITP
jgi:hypothetical protein